MATSRLFDASALMTQNIEANATKRDPLPVGEGIAQVMKLQFTDGVSGPKSKNPGQPWNRLDITLETTDPEYLSQVGDGTREKAVFFHGIMLDMNGGQIATGPDKNVKLGQFREACGANGQPLNQCIGAHVRFAMGQKPNPNDPEAVLNEVIALTRP